MLVTEKSVPLQRFNKAIDCLTKNLQTKMKKLVFLFVACATMSLAVSFSACSGSNEGKDSTDSIDSVAKADSAAQAEAAAAPVEEEVAGDSTTNDSIAE